MSIQEKKIENHKLQGDDAKEVKVEIRYLAHSWLDDFERLTFNGKTLDQVLNQRAYE